LEAARLSKIGDVVLVSSAEIYARHCSNPVAEIDDFTTNFSYPSDGYILSKVMIEMMGHVYAEQFNLRIMFHALQIFTDPVIYLALNVAG